MTRISKENYYLDIAQTVASRSTCLRRAYGAVIVKNDVIVSTGYCGAPRGSQNCCDMGFCLRQKLEIPRGERYEMCRSVHSEANAIIAASHEQMIGATMYQSCIDVQTGQLAQNIDSCQMCKRLIINAGISQVIYRNTPTEYRKAIVTNWTTNN
ncbi:MAG: deaminase [Defluviitaleaceae bacterium]|nr:deaminase [Defluviitaleaceae bacterium]